MGSRSACRQGWETCFRKEGQATLRSIWLSTVFADGEGWCRGGADPLPGRRLGSLLLQAWLVSLKALTLQSLWKVQRKVSTRVSSWGIARRDVSQKLQGELQHKEGFICFSHHFSHFTERASRESIVSVRVPAIVRCPLCVNICCFCLAGKITDICFAWSQKRPLVWKKGTIFNCKPLWNLLLFSLTWES